MKAKIESDMLYLLPESEEERQNITNWYNKTYEDLNHSHLPDFMVWVSPNEDDYNNLI